MKEGMRISVELLRKRAEHNEGEIASLREVSLHQQEIEKIELIGSVCKHLEILYLQSNLIPRIENVGKLKELRYLNLAVNNVQRIEGLERCETLTKLDLTVNFVPKEGLLDLHLLRHNEHLQELYLLGNPCADWFGYRRLVAAELPHLHSLDGQKITPSERIQAQQDYQTLRDTLIRELREEGKDPSYRPPPRRIEDDDEFDASDDEDTNDDAHSDTATWSPEVRIRDHKRLKKRREAAEKGNKKSSFSAPHIDGAADTTQPKRRERLEPLDDSQGLPLQKNEGGWEFSLDESDDRSSIVLVVPVGKYLDTSLLEVDVQPLIVRVLIKGRLLLLRLPEEVSSDSSIAERSKASGDLVVTMPKAGNSSQSGAGLYRRRVDASARKGKVKQFTDKEYTTAEQSARSAPLGKINAESKAPKASMSELEVEGETDDDVPPSLA